jgi:hypothetical protein
MEVKITISDAGTGAQEAASVPVGGPSRSGVAPTEGGTQPAGAMPGGARAPYGMGPGMSEGGPVRYAAEAGAAMGAPPEPGPLSMQMGSPVRPPADLLRAAAALGARSAGPHPC